ncbi:MAG: patatin family protein [Lachnospiraceae bacterium]
MQTASLILEGGANRGIFTAGVLDVLMEKELYMSHVIGVSAGACNAINYVARQIGRTGECMIHTEKEYNYYNGLRSWFKQKSVLDMEMIFDSYPNKLIPFDYNTYFDSSIQCELVTTNCNTGMGDYMQEKTDRDRLMQICRASSSMPLAAPIVNIDGIPYLDGGLADSIPLKRVVGYGNDKIVLILTRNYGYRKARLSRGMVKLYKNQYSKYPNLLKTILRRNQVYNKTMEAIERYELEGRIYVIRPQIKTISRLEKREPVLSEFYQHGYQEMTERYDNLVNYLKH